MRFLTDVRGRKAREGGAARGLSSGALRPRSWTRLRGTQEKPGQSRTRLVRSTTLIPLPGIRRRDQSPRRLHTRHADLQYRLGRGWEADPCRRPPRIPSPHRGIGGPRLGPRAGAWASTGPLGYAIQQGLAVPADSRSLLRREPVGSESGPPRCRSRLTGFRRERHHRLSSSKSHLTTPVDGGAGRYAALRAKVVGTQTSSRLTPDRAARVPGPRCRAPRRGPGDVSARRPPTPVEQAWTAASWSRHASRGEGPNGCVGRSGRWMPWGQGNAADQRTVNDLGMEDYLLGVVPSESPRLMGRPWGGGAGMEALKAQASRCPLLRPRRRNRLPLCQDLRHRLLPGVPGGGPSRAPPATATSRDARATAAVNATAGQVRGQRRPGRLHRVLVLDRRLHGGRTVPRRPRRRGWPAPQPVPQLGT